MSILLSRLYDGGRKSYRMKLIAGKSGLDNPVRWVHIIEDVTFTDFLHGNELVFTTGIRQQGVDWLIGFVLALKDKGAVGLVINTGQYITEIPPQVIVFCEKHDFPLFTVPWQERIIDITYEFCHRIMNSEENEQSLAAAMKNLIFSPEEESGYKNTMLRAGFHNDSRYTVMAVRLTGINGERTPELIKKYNYTFGKLIKRSTLAATAIIQENNLIIIKQNCPAEGMKQLFEKLKATLTDGDRITAGLSGQMDGWQSVSTLYGDAISSLTVALKRGREFIEYGDIGLYKIIFGVRDIGILKSYVESVLGELIQHDEANGTDYVSTLRCYLENNCSVQMVAQIFDVHRNTVNYKIKAIRDILKTTLREEDKMKYLLAFYVADMLEDE